ncbi:histidine kinase [Hymenobacter gummosus]|uniref:Histidine kinase n=1 Tax=Hymenobacter gummosus TaxID=1776032 RepID=A0A3S0H3F0_9BACT|nr:histidine kinase [Hymenobacter gummosus]RTQ47832.1 histidine kinase [Hymenobacter gummosus]
MNDLRIRLIGIPLMSLLITVLTAGHYPLTWNTLLLGWSISLLFTAVLWQGTRTIWGLLVERFPRVEQTARRLWLLLTLGLLYTGAATLGIVLLLHQLVPQYFPLTPRFVMGQIGFCLVPTTIVQLGYESRHFFQQWAAGVRRAEQLQSASQRAQLEALQQQLDPHFLFNSLNTLAALVEPANAPAQQFVEQLADVYRYVLLSRERRTVPLGEELAFVQAYVALQKARLRDNLHVSLAVPAPLLDRHVAPLSVQLLIENALKHNEASRQHPLHVHVTALGEWLMVQNPRRARTTSFTPPGTGTGLRNIRERYALLLPERPVEIEAAESTFTVKLPLI